jgi:hypothetical protein
MKKNLLALLLFLIFSNFSFSQNNSVGIGTLTPDKSAILEIYSSNKGLLIPRLTSTDVAALNNPVNGLLVYNKTVNCFWYYQSNAWKSLCDKRFDSIFATYANIKTLVSSHASFDTLQVGGVDIHNLITNIGDSSYWRLKGNILTDSTKN